METISQQRHVVSQDAVSAVVDTNTTRPVLAGRAYAEAFAAFLAADFRFFFGADNGEG
jgi:hypothetical protein